MKNKDILLYKLIVFLSREGSRLRKVNICDNGDISIRCKLYEQVTYEKEGITSPSVVKEKVKYKTSFIHEDKVFSNSFCNGLEEYYLAYHKGFSDDGITVIKEGVGEVSGKVVSFDIRRIPSSLHSILQELSLEFSGYLKYNGKIGFYVHDCYEDYIDIFPLKNDILCDFADDVIVKADRGKLDFEEFYKAIPHMRGIVNEELFKCLSSVYGNYSMSVSVAKFKDYSIPFMYTIYSKSGVDCLEIC